MTRSAFLAVPLKLTDKQSGIVQTTRAGESMGERVIFDYIDTARRIAFEVYRDTGYRLDLYELRQETVLALVEAYRKGGDPATFEKYAVMRMYGRARDYARNQLGSHGIGKRTHKMAEHVDITECYDIPDGVDPVNVCAARQLIGMIDQLPDRVRRIIWAVHVDNSEYGDIAAELGYVNGSGAWKAQRKAVNKIKELL